MNSKGLDFRKKEVINIKDGRRLGFVQDVTADLESGIIKEIIVLKNSTNPYSSVESKVVKTGNKKY